MPTCTVRPTPATSADTWQRYCGIVRYRRYCIVFIYASVDAYQITSFWTRRCRDRNGKKQADRMWLGLDCRVTIKCILDPSRSPRFTTDSYLTLGQRNGPSSYAWWMHLETQHMALRHLRGDQPITGLLSAEAVMNSTQTASSTRHEWIIFIWFTHSPIGTV